MTPSTTPAGAQDAADWTAAPERSNLAVLRGMCWIALTFGRRAARLALHPITLYFMLFSPDAKRQSKRYLARALGRPPVWRDGYRQVHAFASTVLDRVYLLRRRLELFELRTSGTEVLDATLAEGRGAFLVGAHMGSFEALHAVGRSRDAEGIRVAMVMYPDNARLINETLAAIVPDDKPRVIALGRMESMLEIRDWLDGGGLAGMLGDRTLPGSESERTGSVTVDFLGHPAGFNDGPFRLAALLRRRVIFMVALYLGDHRYDVRFEEIADFGPRPADAAERERRIADAVRAYAARLEALCREQPYNWFNFHDFWREDQA